MKRIALFLLSIWILIGCVSLFIWWKVGRNLNSENMTVHANKVAQELEIPWALRFKKVKPSYGADFRVMIEGIEAIASDGTKILVARNAEVRLPWTIFFSHNPVRINIAVTDVAVTDWVRMLAEIETFLDHRKSDRAQQVSIPNHLIESTFNLRLSRVKGPWEGKEVALDKLYLLNVDPKKPTAFEVVFPWQYQVGGAILSGETKALGEYRFSRQKVDLHYYLRTRLQMQRGNRLRSGDFSVEGKGFFHPRMGLFTTLSAKDDWIALVGDLEWTPDQFKLNVPKFALSHELVLDLLPFTLLHKGTGAYQTAAVQGEFRINRSQTARDIAVSLRTKSNTRIVGEAGEGEQPLNINLVVRNGSSADGSLTLGSVPWITYSHSKNASSLTWSPALFLAPHSSTEWYAPHNEVWDMIWWMPWEKMTVNTSGFAPYVLERFPERIKVTQFKPRTDLPVMGMIYPHYGGDKTEWTSTFDSMPLDPLFTATGKDFFLVPGHAYSGSIWSKPSTGLSLKLAWKGGALPLLSRSSCKALISERAELASLLKDNFVHQAELTFEAPYYRIVRWQVRSQTQEWNISGEWSNSPIKCQLRLKHKLKNKKVTEHVIELN